VRTKFEFHTFIRHKKIWAAPGYAQAPFSPKVLMGICSLIVTVSGTGKAMIFKFCMHFYTIDHGNKKAH